MIIPLLVPLLCRLVVVNTGEYFYFIYKLKKILHESIFRYLVVQNSTIPSELSLFLQNIINDLLHLGKYLMFGS